MKFLLTAAGLCLYSALLSQTLVAKLKPRYHHQLVGDSIHHPPLRLLLTTLGITQTKAVLSSQKEATSLTGVVQLRYRNKENGPILINSLEQSGYFLFVEEKRSILHRPMVIPSDPFAHPDTGRQDYLAKIHAYEAWEITKGDSNAFICVIDNGLDPNHPEFEDQVHYNLGDTLDGLDNDTDGYIDNYKGWDFANQDNNPEDSGTYINHGTEVSGIATSKTNNGVGIASVGYNTKVLPLKIFGQTDDYDAIIYAARHGCKVINLSWGSRGSPSQYEQNVINYAAIDFDAVLVGATWPSEQEGIFTYPGDYYNVISAVGLNATNGKAIPQTYHYWTDISVPANTIFTTYPNGTYGYNSGISLGVPMISGAAALVRAKYPWMNSSQVQDLLRVSSDNIDTIGNNEAYKEKMGHGILNVYRALTDSLPAIHVLKYTLKRIMNDTFSLQFDIKNILWPTKHLQLTIRSIDEGLIVSDSIVSVGRLSMYDSSRTALEDLKFRILPYTSNTTELIRIGLDDSTLNYHDYLYFYLDKKAFTDITTNMKEPLEESPAIQVYPNPSSLYVFVEGEDIQEVLIQDVMGHIVLRKKVQTSLVPFDLSGQASGIYIAKVVTSKHTYSHKFLKQ